MAGTLRSSVDYTDKDFDAIRARLHSLTRSAFPKWTNKTIANFANMLVELFAYAMDVTTFYQDNQAGESRWSTATQRKNLIALCKLITFEPSGASAATVLAKIMLAASPAGDALFEAGTIVKTGSVTDAIEMQLLSDAQIDAGADPAEVEVIAEHSASHEETFVSTELPNQSFILSQTPFLEESQGTSATTMTDAVGDWTEVENFLSSTSTDRHFTITVDQNDKATLLLGNGVNGAIPSGSCTVFYKTGGGEKGNIEEGALSKIEGSFTDSLGNPITPTITNELAASGGSDRMTTEQIREQAPASVRVSDRTVAREDYEIEAERVAGVARALMLTSNEDATIAENSGVLSIIPEGGGTPTQDLLDAVDLRITITKPKTLTFQCLTAPAVYKTINVSVRVSPAKGVATAAALLAMKASIVASLTAFFALQNEDGTKNTNVAFGYYYQDSAGTPDPALPWSDVFDVIRDTTGVRKIADTEDNLLLNGVNDDVTLAVKEFPVLGSVTVINHETGVTL